MLHNKLNHGTNAYRKLWNLPLLETTLTAAVLHQLQLLDLGSMHIAIHDTVLEAKPRFLRIYEKGVAVNKQTSEISFRSSR